MLGPFRLFATEIFLKEKRHAVNLPYTSSFDFGAYYQNSVEFPFTSPAPKSSRADHNESQHPSSPVALFRGTQLQHNTLKNSDPTTSEKKWPRG